MASIWLAFKEKILLQLGTGNTINPFMGVIFISVMGLFNSFINLKNNDKYFLVKSHEITYTF